MLGFTRLCAMNAALAADGCAFSRRKLQDLALKTQQLKRGVAAAGPESDAPLLSAAPAPLVTPQDESRPEPEPEPEPEPALAQSPLSSEEWERVPSWIDREMIEQREEGAHSSQQKIKVEITPEWAVE